MLIDLLDWLPWALLLLTGAALERVSRPIHGMLAPPPPLTGRDRRQPGQGRAATTKSPPRERPHVPSTVRDRRPYPYDVGTIPQPQPMSGYAAGLIAQAWADEVLQLQQQAWQREQHRLLYATSEQAHDAQLRVYLNRYLYRVPMFDSDLGERPPSD